MKPLNTILPNDCDIIDDGEDYGGDFETLRAIQRSTGNGMESSVQRSEKQVGATNIIDLGKESSPNFFVTRNNNRQGFPDSVDGRAANNHISSNINSAANVSEGHEPGSELVPVGDCGFPASAQAFVEAIKKNRTYQKFLRDKLIQVEARLEENKKLRERVKFLKGFQVDCRKRTGRALSHKKDPRFQLISVPKLRANASKIKDTSTLPINQGPAQNPQVAIYQDAMLKYPFSLSREPWSKVDKENLKKGIKQQIQEMMLQNLFSDEGPNSSNLDRMITRIKKHEITHEDIRSFLPKVNWEQLASMYLTGRSGPECESRWRNCEDPLINRGKWTTHEEKKMLHCFSNRGFSNWIDIARELKTNRTPYQCLSRFQRSLNPSILNNEWTPTEDEELRKAVAEYGETNWQLIASIVSGRTGTQCSNRWKKSLNPLRERVGRWDPDEDKRLKIAVRLFGAKNWNKITKFVPGRTQVQCRERWVNCLNPSLKMDRWTEEEDMKLKAAVEEHNYSWARVAACIPPRTDSQCRRRWKVLLPHQVSMLKAAKEIEKRCFVSNFVDREGERPQLTYKDFNKPLLLEAGPKANEDNIISKDKKRRTVGKDGPGRVKKVAHTGKARKLVDEDDVENNDGQADITSNVDGENCEVEKEATGKSKRKGKERSVGKGRPRRARKVAHTGKARKLVDEDDVEDNDGQADITSNGEGHNTCDGVDREDKKEAIGKRKRQGKERRWKVLLPHQVQMLKAAKEIEKRCFVSNFVDREGERPQLTYKDFNKPLLLEAGPKANEDNIISKDKKRRTIGKDGPGRAKKVAHTGKARKLVDEDDLENNDGQADITSNGDGENCEVEKEATGKSKSKEKERSVGKDRPRRARKVAHTGKARKLVDEDDVEDNDGQADITSDGEGHNTCDGVDREDKKEATGKRKRQGKERIILKDRSRRARQVSHTAKVSKLIDEDVGEDNGGHGDVTSNGRLTRQSLKNKANSSLKEARLLEQDNGEGIRTFDGDNREIKKKYTRKRKRKQKVNNEHEEMDENCEPGPISKKKFTKEIVCGLASMDIAEDEAISTNERSKCDSVYVRRSSRVPVMIKDVPSRDERCFSQVILKSMSGDGLQAKTLKKCKVSCKLPNGTNGNHNHGRKRKINIENSISKRKAVDGSGGIGKMVLEDEETFANFLSKLKKEEA
ncbi:myb domain protein 4r1 [Artemisia annua]|uniref:Myb domain protein 4r1 n=1 Tax=Artemisia annua TaxID=35608 RepID=A0A2U1PHQ1_ARTAN|nr:myb domain protein 4r1 [Artemisia annua]